MTNSTGRIVHLHAKKKKEKKIDPCLLLYIKRNTKCIIDLIRFKKKKIGKDLKLGKNFTDVTPKS